MGRWKLKGIPNQGAEIHMKYSEYFFFSESKAEDPFQIIRVFFMRINKRKNH